MFAYCNNNPVMYSDPAGESITIATLILIGSAIVGAVSAGYTAYVEYNAGFDTVQIIGDSICAGMAGFCLVYSMGMTAYQCYQNYCYLNGLTPVTNIGPTTTSQTTVYRSVSSAEARSIQSTGEFSIADGGMESKQFGFSLSETKQFGNIVGQKTVVSATLPTSALDQFCKVSVDSTIFRNGTLTVYYDKLDTFNRLVAGTIMIME